jgi:hypothetical protein
MPLLLRALLLAQERVRLLAVPLRPKMDRLRTLAPGLVCVRVRPARALLAVENFNNRECLHCRSGARSFEEVLCATQIQRRSPPLNPINSGAYPAAATT